MLFLVLNGTFKTMGAMGSVTTCRETSRFTMTALSVRLQRLLVSWLLRSTVGYCRRLGWKFAVAVAFNVDGYVSEAKFLAHRFEALPSCTRVNDDIC